MWRPISTYPLPSKLYDYEHPEALFYDKKYGIKQGHCIKLDDDPDEWRFCFDRDEYEMEPTHWMPLPDAPTE